MGYAVITRYHGPTNYRGSRVIGTGPAVSMDDARDGRYTRATVAWDYGASNGTGRSESDVMHRRAAEAVAAKLTAAGWRVTLAPGDGATLPDDSGRVFMLRYGADDAPTRRERAAALLSDTDIAGILDIAGEDA